MQVILVGFDVHSKCLLIEKGNLLLIALIEKVWLMCLLST